MNDLLDMGQRIPQKKNLFDSKKCVYLCPTANCRTYVSTKRSIKRHLMNCNETAQIRNKHKQNKICKYGQKKFQKKFKRYRQVKQCHVDKIDDGRTMDFIDIDLIVTEMQPNE